MSLRFKHETLKVYPGAPHGLTATLVDHVNADLLTPFEVLAQKMILGGGGQ